MLRAVLFDLDGTLLDIDLQAFLDDYFASLGPLIAELAEGVSAGDAVSAVVESTAAMCTAHPGRTNREVFHEHFLDLTGLDLDSPEPANRVTEFYEVTFPRLRRTHAAMSGGHRAVAAARSAGLRTAVATNPIFPRAAVDERMRWAGLEQHWFDLVTTYEVMSACKPQTEYFEQVAAMLGVHPSECLMIGDDAELDLPAAAAGMLTFYVGSPLAHTADWEGSLDDVPALITDLLG